jgi:pimeloyl-ACP methyl ester carboxylesterase
LFVWFDRLLGSTRLTHGEGMTMAMTEEVTPVVRGHHMVFGDRRFRQTNRPTVPAIKVPAREPEHCPSGMMMGPAQSAEPSHPAQSCAAPPQSSTVTASLLLVHGAGSGPWVFRGWAQAFPGMKVAAVDLHAGLDVARASHDDYADAVARAARALPEPVSLCGWSMGGLVILQACTMVNPHSVILLEPSPPAEVQGVNLAVEVKDGTFDPEAVYGPFPHGIRSRPESSRARAERKRGISVPSLSCPSLVVYGDEYRQDRGRRIALTYDSLEMYFPGLNHWGLVRSAAVRAAIARYLVPISTS